MDKNFVPRLFTSYCKLHYDCIFSKKKKKIISSNAKRRKQMLHELRMNHLKVLVKWNWWWNFTCVCTISLKFEFFFSLVPKGNCFRCYFRQLLISLALRKCKKDCKIHKIILVLDFCPLRIEIARFSIGFRLNLIYYVR